jgi:hypothetical protein
MKKIRYYITFVLALSVIGACHKLDTPPLGVISDEDVFDNANAVQAFLANIYNSIPIEDFIYEPNTGFMQNNGGRWQCFFHTDAIDGEMVGPFGGTGDASQGFGYWPYDKIRNINILIETLPRYARNFSADQVSEWLGEAHFCRAYTYFGLVKRYGGIPIVKDVVDASAPLDSLMVPRNTEAQVYDFIGNDFDSAFNLMWEPGANGNPAIQQGAASKYAAKAYKSLAMLFAGSIAKYGSVNFVAGPAQQKGIVGIPTSEAGRYFQASVDAAKVVEGHFNLYTGGYPDKVQNYVDLFLKPNNEQIFLRQYTQADPNTNDNLAGPHSWDATMTCRIMTADGLSRAYPTLDYVERFGAMPVVNPDGTPRRFDKQADVMTGLEPRLLATVYFPGATLRGITFDVYRGIYGTFNGSAAQELSNNLNTPNDGLNTNLWIGTASDTHNGMDVIGRAGVSTSGDDYTRTGLYVRKYVDYNKAASACGLYQSTQSYIDMRYAEVMLNRAEADFELGDPASQTDALNMINQLRDRAGAAPAIAGSMTIDTIRNERCKELAFEHQYWWDIRRWRTADQVLNNRNCYALIPYYVASENKYIFLKQIEPFKRTYSFQKLWYYEPLPGGELSKDPNLYPNNPGY